MQSPRNNQPQHLQYLGSHGEYSVVFAMRECLGWSTLVAYPGEAAKRVTTRYVSPLPPGALGPCLTEGWPQFTVTSKSSEEKLTELTFVSPPFPYWLWILWDVTSTSTSNQKHAERGWAKSSVKCICLCSREGNQRRDQWCSITRGHKVLLTRSVRIN